VQAHGCRGLRGVHRRLLHQVLAGQQREVTNACHRSISFIRVNCKKKTPQYGKCPQRPTKKHQKRWSFTEGLIIFPQLCCFLCAVYSIHSSVGFLLLCSDQLVVMLSRGSLVFAGQGLDG
jgi:hypothetical protein